MYFRGFAKSGKKPSGYFTYKVNERIGLAHKFLKTKKIVTWLDSCMYLSLKIQRGYTGDREMSLFDIFRTTIAAIRRGCLAAVLVVAGSATGHAAIVFSNITEPLVGDLDVTTTNTSWGAESFATGANAYTVDSIDVLVKLIGSTSQLIAIYSDAAGEPGAQVGDLLTFASDLGSERRSYESNGSITLAPFTDYWLVVGSTGGGSPRYRIARSLNSVGPYTLNDLRASTDDSGSTWDASQSVEPLVFEIDATLVAVPGPSALSLLGLAVAMLAAATWRRRRVA